MTTKANFTAEDALAEECVQEAVKRGVIEFKDGRVTYHLGTKKSYEWRDPEEWVRARSIAFLIVERDYPANRILTEVQVPRRTPSDLADVVVYRDDARKHPYLVIENKAANQSPRARSQAIEQAFGNANSLRAELTLYDEFSDSALFDVTNYPAGERTSNHRGFSEATPAQYGDIPEYPHIAGQPGDIRAARANVIEASIRRAHSTIWSGGKRDPLTAFDEWSKLLFAKVIDERSTPTGEPRRFQVGAKETTAAVANRIHKLFEAACKEDRSIFPDGIRINLPDKKIFEIVTFLQSVSFTGTEVDHIGIAFEGFFGAIFRGELGQYFTMRQLARFTVAMLGIDHTHFVLDPTSGSGGFLLEVLLQCWHNVDRDFAGQAEPHVNRIKTDFALTKVFGIEIHETLARISKINLLLHHDGHTNIEGDRSCLDATFDSRRLANGSGTFHRVVGNPPFGDDVEDGDEDHLGTNSLSAFAVAQGRSSVASEHAILERAVSFLDDGGRLGFILPDGLFNNQGENSNCPAVRRFLATHGYIEAIVSLPDFAFRKSGAQNKTSILFFRKFTKPQRRSFEANLAAARENTNSESDAIATAWSKIEHRVFLAEANHIGYAPTGAPTNQNDLYRRTAADGRLCDNQSDTILGEFREFERAGASYAGSRSPECFAVDFAEIWSAHPSHRLDPKYHIFKHEERSTVPDGWMKTQIGKVMRRREHQVDPASEPEKRVVVMTLGQNGEIRPREAGKGRTPPEWLGAYFADIPSKWFAARSNDVVFSSIDLWKGCIAVVPSTFDGALVTKEFPIYEVETELLDPEFLSFLLRSRYYQRAFRAITTGHSNRRRTQREDFEALEICFPKELAEQRRLIAPDRKSVV